MYKRNCGVSQSGQRKVASFGYNYKTSQVTAYSFSVFACLQLAEVKCGHLLTGSIGSGYTAWLVMHSFFTNRRSIKKSLRMIKTPSAIQLG